MELLSPTYEFLCKAFIVSVRNNYLTYTYDIFKLLMTTELSKNLKMQKLNKFINQLSKGISIYNGIYILKYFFKITKINTIYVLEKYDIYIYFALQSALKYNEYKLYISLLKISNVFDYDKYIIDIYGFKILDSLQKKVMPANKIHKIIDTFKGFIQISGVITNPQLLFRQCIRKNWMLARWKPSSNNNNGCWIIITKLPLELC